VALTHDSVPERRLSSRLLWIAALGALVLAGAVAATLTLTLTGGGAKSQVLGAIALDQPLAGATVDFSNGATAKTDAAGNFLAATHVPKTFSVTVSGGTANGQLSSLKLAGDYDNFDPKTDVLTVNVLTTIVSRYRQAHSGATIAQADARLRKALALPSDLDYHLNHSFVDPWFSSDRFVQVAAQSGGFEAAVSHVLDGMEQNRFVARYPATAKNPGGQTAAAFVSGKLLEGAGSAAAGAVIGMLMSQAGLDPTTNALKEINAKLEQLSAQISALQQTTDKTLNELLQEKFQNKITFLPFTTIRSVQSDLQAYTAETSPNIKEAYKLKVIDDAKNFNAVVDAFNDVMNPTAPGTLSVVQLYAKTTLFQKRFWAIHGQRETEKLFDYMDGMQVAAATAYSEYLFLSAPADRDPAVTLERAKLEAKDLRAQRAGQIARNEIPTQTPSYWSGGVIDIDQKLWIRNSPINREQGGQTGAQVRGWGLPTVAQLHSIVAGRGDKTVKRYLAEDLGLTTAMDGVPEFGVTGELWTNDSVASPTGCGTLFFNSSLCQCGHDGRWCLRAASTNNAYVRVKEFCCSNDAGPKLYVVQVQPLTAYQPDITNYSYLWS